MSGRWLPLVGWVQEKAGVHTRLNLFPSGFARDPDEKFDALIQLYHGGNNLVLEHRTPPATIHQPIRLEFGDLLKKNGIESFDGITEILIRQIGVDPRTPRFLEVWFDIYSDNHEFDVSIPGIPIVGSIKVPFAGQYRYQLYPGVVYNDEVESRVLIINPYTRVIDVVLRLYTADGRQIPCPPRRIAPRHYLLIDLKDAFPAIKSDLAPTGIGTIVVGSTFKLLDLVMCRHLRSKTVTALDHMVPFIQATHQFQPGADDQTMKV